MKEENPETSRRDSENAISFENYVQETSSKTSISSKWINPKKRKSGSTIADHCSKNEIIREICATVLNRNSMLKVTQSEAINLLSSLLNKEQILEKVKKIEIEREPYQLEYNSKFKKYFEIVGHNGIIERICYDNGAKFAFTGGADGAIKCWNIVNGMLVRSLYGHTNMISDLCISRNGEHMVSVDYQGLMNIWSLKTFEIIHSIQFSSEAIFCEFIYPSNSSKMALGNIFIIFSDGIVKLVEFDANDITAKLANKFMLGESIKAICITDGGRFVICGGWWPFFLIYDTCDLDKIIVAENFRIQALCAAKNALKFAASSENRIHIYTFFSENTSVGGGYIKKKLNTGFWKKTVNEIDSEYFVEWICFLPSYLLVAACTDSVIRLYEDDSLVFSFSGESGAIYSHPFKNIFAVVGTNLTIYQFSSKKNFSEFPDFDSTNDCYKLSHLSHSESDFKVTNTKLNDFHVEKLFSEMIYVNLNDCQFSDDGRFLITCDDQGIIKTYSIEDTINVPEQQFFLKDIDRDISNENFTETYNIYRQKNPDWVKLEYQITSTSVDWHCIQIENQAAKILEKDKLNEDKFRALYLSGDTPEVQKTNEDLNRSSFLLATGSDRDETYILSDESEKSSESGLRNASSYVSSKESGKSSSGSSERSLKSRRRMRKTQKLRGFRNVKTADHRRIIYTDDESEPRNEIKKKRKLLISESDDSPVIIQRIGLRNFKESISSKNVKSKHFLRRNLVDSEEDSIHSEEYQAPTRRILRRNFKQSIEDFSDSSSGEIKRPLRSASISNQLKLKSEQNSKRNSFHKESYTGSSKSSSSYSSPRRTSNEARTKLKNITKHKSYDEVSQVPTSDNINWNSNHKNSYDPSETRVLRKHLRNSDNLFSRSLEQSPKRFLRRNLPFNNPVLTRSEPIANIDEDFEEKLCKFSYTWLASCSIYPNTRVYFNRPNYEKFMNLEQRIIYSKKFPPVSGFYDITAVQLDFIGKIPYLTMAIGHSYIIKVYEYPDSEGILCTDEQFALEQGQAISYFKKSRLIQDAIITEIDEMFMKVDETFILKSLALIKFDSLNLAEIPYSTNLKPLFASFPSSRVSLEARTNLNLINKKLNHQFYRKDSDFLYDLKTVVEEASKLSKEAEIESQAILQEYETAINEHTVK